MNHALLLVDLQNDFFPGGALPVREGNHVIAPVNRLIKLAQQEGWPIFATRDWHPKNHCSFREQGGPWPPHCIQGSAGAHFNPRIHLPSDAVIISTADSPSREAYSGFEGTDLAQRLRDQRVTSVVVGGLATDYCVKETVMDALREGLEVTVIRDAVRGVDVLPNDSKKALVDMQTNGARLLSIDEFLIQTVAPSVRGKI